MPHWKRLLGAGLISLLLFMIVLGVIRIRSAQQRGGGSGAQGGDVNMEERQEMEWDNSALTITVNPMDQDVRDQTYYYP